MKSNKYKLDKKKLKRKINALPMKQLFYLYKTLMKQKTIKFSNANNISNL
jgi:hypothetical protein